MTEKTATVIIKAFKKEMQGFHGLAFGVATLNCDPSGFYASMMIPWWMKETRAGKAALDNMLDFFQVGDIDGWQHVKNGTEYFIKL